MKFHPRFLSSVAVLAITCVVCAAAYYYKSRNSEINEVMVFCKLQFNAYNCFDKLMSYIEAARRCVDVCMPAIHNSAIQGRLVKLIKEKNIKVRLIVDQSGFKDSADFLIKELIETGAEIRYKNTTSSTMQHKFCLIDNKMLMTGTLNWGHDRSSDHWNYIYVTNKPQLVEPVKNEFHEMWNLYSCEIEDHLKEQSTPELCDNEECQNIENVIKSESVQKDSVTPELVTV